MSGTERTPVRESVGHDSSTMSPGEAVDVDSLVGSMSSIKIDSQHIELLSDDTVSDLPINNLGRQKRINRESIEGSPFILKKRTNLQTTPIAFQHCQNSYVNETESSQEIKRVLQTHASHAIFSPAPSAPLTVIFSGSDEHDTGDHQENSRRTKLLVGTGEGCLRRESLQPYINWIDGDSISPPPITDLLRVHEFEYLEHLERKCRQSAGHNYEGLPFFAAPSGRLDTDTPLTDQSLEAAKRFCGAAIAAVDILMENHFVLRDNDKSKLPVEAQSSSSSSCKTTTGKSVFVIGRPPGHHAGPNGCVPSVTYWKAPGMTSSGFCLLNTVAVAAAYARHEYGRMSQSRQRFSRAYVPTVSRPPRVAIVDIDIHHGNGTEEIVRNLRPHQTFLPLPSSWAPQSKLSYKPWLNEQDAEETLFASVHLFNHEDFYPGSGEENPEDITNNNIINITLTPISTEGKPKSGLSKKALSSACLRASQEFREKMQRILFPQLQRFKADILFISAGFDAHFDDFYHFLTEDDIHWVTSEMMAICSNDNPNHIGVISVLEGGYSLEGLYDKPAVSEVVTGPRTRKPSSKAAAAHAPLPNEDITVGPANVTEKRNSDVVAGKYAQISGDGGLVKSVLAHAAALSGRSAWV